MKAQTGTMENNLTFRYLSETEIDEPKYVAFFEKYHGEGSFDTWGKKIHWYFNTGHFRLLVAENESGFVGQATAYMAKACVFGEEKEIWWGADAFVLAEMRGKSIGKLLQKKLHEDLPNFSSVAYAALNGIIKRKCGAKEIKSVQFYFYPVSCFFSILLELAIRKLTRKDIQLPRLRLPSLYLRANLLSCSSAKQLVIREIAKKEVPDLSAFMEDCLKEEDFHIIRSKEFLKWKYTDNPLTSFKALSAEKDGEQVGIVILSDTYQGTYLLAQARLAKLYDCVVKKASGVSQEQVLKAALAYLRPKWQEAPDGILAIQKIPYCPKITYPRDRAFLSTLECKELNSLYLSYIDQDMERME